jgi:hypothetical protein
MTWNETPENSIILESVVKTRSECDCSAYFTQFSLWLLCLTES